MTITNSTSVVFTTDAHNDRYRDASRRLADRSAAIRERLMGELAQAQDHHEIDWRSLLSSQRDIAEQAGSPPDIETYWTDHAQPRSEALTARCMQIIDAHLLLLFDAVSVFTEGVRPALTLNGEPPSAEAIRSLRVDVERLIQPVTTAALDRSTIDALGQRWQERLRRQAIRRYVRSGGVTDSTFSSAIDNQELKMMHQAPWAHADQLLSGFELAHAEIKRGLVDRVDRMLNDLLRS